MAVVNETTVDKEARILEDIKQVEGSNLWMIVMRRIRKDQLGMVGFWIVMFLIAMGIIAFLIDRYDAWFGLMNPTGDLWDQNNYYIELWIPGTQKYLRLIAHPEYIIPGAQTQPPSLQHPFGTDTRGYDILSRIFFGSTLSLILGFVGQMVRSIIGLTIGAISGYYGGIFDDVMQRVNEVISAMPNFILFIFIVSIFQESATNFPGGIYMVIIIVFAAVGWGGTSLIVRSTVLSLKNTEFVEAERALGARDARIIFKHIIPNSLSPVIVVTTLGIANTIIAIAGLAFFGLGDATAVTWGDDLAYHRDNLMTHWWMPTWPSIMIFLTVLGFNLLGDALRDALDPKLKS
ncbi:MAG: ABC transporter permease subunit [Candidatus Heimdallarchaeota archaeon]|nr:ABC transporter permease subunit [Candidatus Heimdallarchaeota archaeon]